MEKSTSRQRAQCNIKRNAEVAALHQASRKSYGRSRIVAQ
jgi:hypothetical protein